MKRLMAKVGTYEKNGETKGEYVRIGVIMSNDNGEYALLDPTVNLAGVLTKQNMMNHELGKKTGKSVMCSVFTDQQNNTSSNVAPPPAGDPDLNDDIPFQIMSVPNCSTCYETPDVHIFEHCTVVHCETCGLALPYPDEDSAAETCA